MAPAENDRPRGASLLQLSLALIVVSVLASIGVPMWFGRGAVTLDSAAILLARDLQRVQELAASRGDGMAVVFDVEGDGYRVLDAEQRAVRAPLGDGAFERIYSRDAAFRGVHVVEHALGPEATVRFDAAGAVHTGGSVTLAFHGERRVLVIDPEGTFRIEGMARPWDDGR